MGIHYLRHLPRLTLLVLALGPLKEPMHSTILLAKRGRGADCAPEVSSIPTEPTFRSNCLELIFKNSANLKNMHFSGTNFKPLCCKDLCWVQSMPIQYTLRFCPSYNIQALFPSTSCEKRLGHPVEGCTVFVGVILHIYIKVCDIHGEEAATFIFPQGRGCSSICSLAAGFV